MNDEILPAASRFQPHSFKRLLTKEMNGKAGLQVGKALCACSVSN
jgi:hypothetical protein